MNQKMFFTVAFAAIVISMLLCPVFATAAETERFWVRMNPDRFEPTSMSAFEQCSRAAQLPDSGVSEESCKTLKVMLDKGECKVELVPDGIRLDLMSTYEGGNPTVVGPMTKKLGRKDQATVCDLGNGVVTYFFIGSETSCGNLAFVVERPEVVAAKEKGQSDPVARKCRWVSGQMATSRETITTVIVPMVLKACGGGYITAGGGVNTTTLPESSFMSSRRVCDD